LPPTSKTASPIPPNTSVLPRTTDTCWYLGSLIDRFGRSDQLFSYDHGDISLRPLALLYGDALEASNERDRCLILRQVGDMALFLGALFPERFARHGIQKEYFIGMGGGAYDYLANKAFHNRHIFAELSRSFARMLELVAKACARRQTVSAVDVLSLYQRWRETGDPLVASQLQALGIDPSGADTIQ
jgi:hypothetical protein